MSQNPAMRDFGSIWAVGLPVFPPLRLPSLACTAALPLAACACRVPASRDHPSIQATPRGHASSQSYFNI